MTNIHWHSIWHYTWITLFWLWVAAAIGNDFNRIFHISLWRQIKKGKRKFYWVKLNIHLQENNGAYEFWWPDAYVERVRNYLIGHPYEVEQLVEERTCNTDPERFQYFVAVNEKGKWDYSFADKSRRSTNFHVEKRLVVEQVPAKFSFRYGLTKPKA